VGEPARPPHVSPDVQISAVPSTGRTINVSSRTPRAANPISANDTTGKVARTEKVPASTSPAEVITPRWQPADEGAGPGAVLRGLLVDSGHQEDVV